MEQGAAAQRRGRGLADGDQLDVDRELLGHRDEEQVHVQGSAGDGVDLDAVDEHRLGLVAVDRQVHERIRADLSAELVEFVAVDRHVR